MAPMKVNGTSLRAIRTAQGRSVRDVAAAARIDPGYLSRIENGEREPTDEVIGRIAEALEVARDAFAAEAGARPRTIIAPSVTGLEVLMTAKEIGPILRMDTSTVHRRVKQKRLGCIKDGNRTLFARRHIEAYMRDNEVAATPIQMPMRPAGR